MHEWALAEGVAATAVQAAQKEGLKTITRVIVALGELQQIDPKVFRFLLKDVIGQQAPMLSRARVVIKTERAILVCRSCSHEWPFRDASSKLGGEKSEYIHFVPEMAHAYLHCPRCRSQDFDMTKGRGVWLESVTGTK